MDGRLWEIARPMTTFLRYLLSFFDFADYFPLPHAPSASAPAARVVESNNISAENRRRQIQVLPEDDCEVWRHLFAMNRNLKRRNSKRFVIGDGDDESPVTIPEMTITEAAGDEVAVSDWIPIENSKLKVRATLT